MVCSPKENNLSNEPDIDKVLANDEIAEGDCTRCRQEISSSECRVEHPHHLVVEKGSIVYRVSEKPGCLFQCLFKILM